MKRALTRTKLPRLLAGPCWVHPNGRSRRSWSHRKYGEELGTRHVHDPGPTPCATRGPSRHSTRPATLDTAVPGHPRLLAAPCWVHPTSRSRRSRSHQKYVQPLGTRHVHDPTPTPCGSRRASQYPTRPATLDTAVPGHPRLLAAPCWVHPDSGSHRSRSHRRYVQPLGTRHQHDPTPTPCATRRASQYPTRPATLDTAVPDTLAYWRHRAGLTQQRVAAALGVATGTFSHWERGTRRTPPRHHAALAELLNIPPDKQPWPQLTPDTLAYWRHRAGLTQTAVADALEVATSTFRNWENGAWTIPPRRHAALAELLDIPPDKQPWPQVSPDTLAYWRHRAGLTQTAVADALGVATSTFSQWERGRYRTPARHHTALAEASRHSTRQAALDTALQAALQASLQASVPGRPRLLAIPCGAHSTSLSRRPRSRCKYVEELGQRHVQDPAPPPCGTGGASRHSTRPAPLDTALQASVPGRPRLLAAPCGAHSTSLSRRPWSHRKYVEELGTRHVHDPAPTPCGTRWASQYPTRPTPLADARQTDPGHPRLLENPRWTHPNGRRRRSRRRQKYVQPVGTRRIQDPGPPPRGTRGASRYSTRPTPLAADVPGYPRLLAAPCGAPPKQP